jgi:hypothetical protein
VVHDCRSAQDDLVTIREIDRPGLADFEKLGTQAQSGDGLPQAFVARGLSDACRVGPTEPVRDVLRGRQGDG